MDNAVAALKEEFLEIIDECLKNGESKKALAAFKDPKYASCVESSAWDLVPKIVEQVTHPDKRISVSCEEILVELVQLTDPDEMLLELIEKVEEAKSDSCLLALIPPMQMTLSRMPEKRGRSLLWCLNAIIQRLHFPRPGDDSDESEDENELAEVERILKLYRAGLQFCEPFIEEVALTLAAPSYDGPVAALHDQQRKVLLTFLIQVLSQTLANSDLDSGDGAENPFRILAEDTMRTFCRVCSDALYFLTFMEARSQISERMKNTHEIWNPFNPFLFEEVTPIAGLGTLYYLILVQGMRSEYAPVVYNPQFVFRSILHVVVGLIARPQNLAVLKGFELAKAVLRRLGRPPLSADLLDDPIHSRFCKATIQIVFRNGSERVARLAVSVVKTYLKSFSHEGQYLVLKNLFASLEEQGHRGFLVTLLKDSIDRSLREHKTEGDVSVFRGASLFGIIKMFCSFPDGSKTDAVQHGDHIIAALNLAWYLAMCREAQFLWTGELIMWFADNLLEPLSEAVLQCRRNYELQKAELSKCAVDGDKHRKDFHNVKEQLRDIETILNRLILIDNLIGDVAAAIEI